MIHIPNATHKLKESLCLIPTELKEIQQWVMWRIVDGRKIPFTTTGRSASSTKPKTWASFDAAIASYRSGGFAGIGFVFAKDDPYCGIDLDHCIKPDGTLEAWAAKIIQDFASYAEVSPSGTGVKIFIRGKKPSAKCRFEINKATGQHIEIYDSGRYFTVTGNRWADCPLVISDRQPKLNTLFAEYFSGQAPPVTKPELPPLTEHVKNNASTHERCHRYLDTIPGAISGQGGHNRTLEAAATCFRFGLSESDAWNLLTEFNERCQPPWNERELRHKLADGEKLVRGAGEFGKLLDGRSEPVAAAPRPTTAAPAAVPKAPALKFLDVANCRNYSKPQAWAFKGWIPSGLVTVLGAHGGTGKSMFSLIAAICLAAGHEFLGQQCEPIKACYFSAEDGPDILYPRMAAICDALDEDPATLADRLTVIDAESNPVLFEEVTTGKSAMITTPTYAALLEHIQQTGCKFVIIDGASDTYDGEENARRQVRAYMRSLRILAQATNAAIVLLAHVPKTNTRGQSTESYSGSTAWHNSARSRLALVVDEFAPGIIELRHEKCNVGKLQSAFQFKFSDSGILLPVGQSGEVNSNADKQAILRIIMEFNARGETLYASTACAQNAFKAMAGEPGFPKKMRKPAFDSLMRSMAREGLIQIEQIQTKQRRFVDGWRIAELGIAAINVDLATGEVLESQP